jgi:hypothetical protein
MIIVSFAGYTAVRNGITTIGVVYVTPSPSRLFPGRVSPTS